MGSSQETSLLDKEVDDLEYLDFRDFASDRPLATNTAPPPWELSGPREYGPSLDVNGREERVIWGLHLPYCEGAVTVEGSAANLRYNQKAEGSDTYPFENLSVLLLSQFTSKYKVSRVMLRGMLEMLRFVDDDGSRFNIDDLKDVHHEHFQARRRKYYPLLQVVKRKVEASATAKIAGETTADAYDIPTNLVVDRLLRSAPSMEEMLSNQGGKQLSRDETAAAGLASTHIFSVPEEKADGTKGDNQNGELARSTPHFGFDGIMVGMDGKRKVYVNDIVMCTLDGVDDAHPWDAAKLGVMVELRRFRLAVEVDGQYSTYLAGTDFIRAWEQQDDGKTAVRREAIDGPCEMYTAAEVADKVHEDERANEALAEQDARRYFAEGFVVPKPPPEGGRRRRKRALDDGYFSVKCDRWSPEGTSDDPKFSIRKSEFIHNVENHPAAMLPLVQYIDGLNADGMQTKASSWKRCKCMWLALQRRRGQANVVAVASNGCSCTGEMEL
ncbi:unnamed protein product [Ectocarpus sp. 13 AM-2016]